MYTILNLRQHYDRSPREGYYLFCHIDKVTSTHYVVNKLKNALNIEHAASCVGKHEAIAKDISSSQLTDSDVNNTMF